MIEAMTVFKAVHPTLPVADIERTVRFYTDKLGFRLGLRDPSSPDHYMGVRRDGAEPHFQQQDAQGLPIQGTQIRLADTPWGTREFGLFDPDRHALAFYRDL